MDKSVIKKAGAAVLSYAVIYVIALVFAVLRLSLKDDSSAEISFWDMIQFLIVPALFYAAGYIVTNKQDFPKMKAKVVLLASVIFGGVLLGLWYISLDASVMCNLPVAQGCYALDHWIRKINIVYEYEYTYLAKTDLYRNATLPLLYFVMDVLYWLCYLWGNHVCVSKRTPVAGKR